MGSNPISRTNGKTKGVARVATPVGWLVRLKEKNNCASNNYIDKLSQSTHFYHLLSIHYEVLRENWRDRLALRLLFC